MQVFLFYFTCTAGLRKSACVECLYFEPTLLGVHPKTNSWVRHCLDNNNNNNTTRYHEVGLRSTRVHKM